ncbi:hypothetical protein CU098_007094, partial [Rhizopus stolonifer]
YECWSYPEHSYYDLKSIALCCRRLYLLCLPFLWKHKEFILPAQDDQKTDNDNVHVATDILSKKAQFQYSYLGDYVRSLYRDLTNSPYFDLHNSMIMAQLVSNLKALRIDFHPMTRTEHYGLRYFVEHCPHLGELYLSHCRDTFDDFSSLITFQPPLISLTLVHCTIKQTTFEKLAEFYSASLESVFLEQVLIEPDQQSLFPYQPTSIPQSLVQSLFQSSRLVQLALTTDSMSISVLCFLVDHAPYMEKLTIMLYELIPVYVQRAIETLSRLVHLSTLSLKFNQCYPDSGEYTKLPCHAPSSAWTLFATQFPKLQLLHIATTRLLVTLDFIPILLRSSPLLKNIMIHNLALVTEPYTQLEKETHRIREAYLNDCETITFDLQKWQDYRRFIYSYEEARMKGFDCFDRQDQNSDVAIQETLNLRVPEVCK